MFHCVLFEPEIPQNTGNIMRLCVNMPLQLHLIHPLGFELDNKRLRRAGLDYREWADVKQYQSFAEFIEQVNPPRLFACSTKGAKYYNKVAYQKGDAFVFGPETRGLPADILAQFATDNIIKIPMQAHSRSLNLANSVAVIGYQAWQQHDFAGIA